MHPLSIPFVKTFASISTAPRHKAANYQNDYQKMTLHRSRSLLRVASLLDFEV
jgi:hypothetical protein